MKLFFLGLGFLFSEALFILLSSLSLSVCVQLNSATTPLLSLSKNVYFVSVSLSFCILIYFFLSLGQRQSLCCFVLLLGHSLSLSQSFNFCFINYFVPFLYAEIYTTRNPSLSLST